MAETNVLENAASIAVKSLEKIQAPMKAKEAEAKAKSDADNQKAEQAKREKESKIASEAEARAKEDSRILAEPDDKLGEPEKKRKAELLEIKRKEEETPEGKIKRVKEETQRRIDEIKSEMLAKENQREQKLAALEAELAELKKPKQVEDIKAKVKREQAEQIAKYVEEDKSKPKEERREMSKDDLDSWYLEDPVEATKWIQRTEYRSCF